MRIGVISDPHGNVLGLQAVLDALSADTRQIVCAGDTVGYYPYVNETIDLLRARNVVCIAGNHDRYLRGDSATTPERWKAYQLDYVASVITPANRDWLEAHVSGVLLIQEAGGLVSDLAGESAQMETGNVVAGTPKIFGQLLPIIQSYRPATMQA